MEMTSLTNTLALDNVRQLVIGHLVNLRTKWVIRERLAIVIDIHLTAAPLRLSKPI